MTKERFKEGRERLGLSLNDLARVFGVSSGRTVRKWEKGDRSIPGPAAALMNILAFDTWPKGFE